MDVVFNTGLSLDPTFTAKAFRGMITEMNENPTSFKGRRVLFIHTGMYIIVCMCIPRVYNKEGGSVLL